MADKTKKQLVQSLWVTWLGKGKTKINNVTIVNAGEKVKVNSLVVDDDELGVLLDDWFIPVEELTKAELLQIYRAVR